MVGATLGRHDDVATGRTASVEDQRQLEARVPTSRPIVESGQRLGTTFLPVSCEASQSQLPAARPGEMKMERWSATQGGCSFGSGRRIQPWEDPPA